MECLVQLPVLCSSVSTLVWLKNVEMETRDDRKVTLENPKLLPNSTFNKNIWHTLPVPVSLARGNSQATGWWCAIFVVGEFWERECLWSCCCKRESNQIIYFRHTAHRKTKNALRSDTFYCCFCEGVHGCTEYQCWWLKLRMYYANKLWKVRQLYCLGFYPRFYGSPIRLVCRSLVLSFFSISFTVILNDIFINIERIKEPLSPQPNYLRGTIPSVLP